MKKKYPILVLCLWLLTGACAPKVGVFEPAEPGRALFEKAEQKFDLAKYAEAGALYQEYLQEYPAGERTAEALLKIGMILAQQQRFNPARERYMEVIARYPGTPQAQTARVKILETYLNQGHFREVIDYRKQIPAAELRPEMRVQADLLAGDAYMALEKYRLAYHVFADAWRRAAPEARKKAADRMLAAISGLDTDYIDKEIQRLAGDPPSGYLMFQQGLNAISDGRIGDALSVLNRFVEQYPDHPRIGQARKEIASLSSAAFFEGHTLGCVLPLTGTYRKFGRQVLRGVELAMLHASGRMQVDPPFRILIRDSRSEAETARNAVEELAKKRVAAIIGPIAAADAAAAIAQKRGIPVFPITQDTGIGKNRDFVFINFLTPRMQTSALVKYTTRELACRRFAVLYPDEPYGRTFLHVFWDALLENHARLVAAESYNPAHTDFAEPIKKLVGLYYDLPEDLVPRQMKPAQVESLARHLEIYGGIFSGAPPPGPAGKQGPAREEPYNFGMNIETQQEQEPPDPIVDFDAIFIPDAPEKAGLIIPQLRFYDINNVCLLGTNLWHSQKLIDIAGYQIDRAVIPEGFFAKSRRPVVSEFVRAFEKIYGYTPGFMEAIGYDTAMMLCKQIARKDISTRPALRQGLVQMPPYEGVTGRTVFRENGEAEKSIYLLKVEGRQFEEISR